MTPSDRPIEALLAEERTFQASAALREQANISDPAIYERASKDPDGFWAEAASSLHWFKPWDKVLEWNPPLAQWFIGGKINVSYNCVDRHAKSWRRNKAA